MGYVAMTVCASVTLAGRLPIVLSAPRDGMAQIATSTALRGLAVVTENAMRQPAVARVMMDSWASNVNSSVLRKAHAPAMDLAMKLAVPASVASFGLDVPVIFSVTAARLAPVTRNAAMMEAANARIDSLVWIACNASAIIMAKIVTHTALGMRRALVKEPALRKANATVLLIGSVQNAAWRLG